MRVLVTGGRDFALPVGTPVGDLCGDGVVSSVEAAEQFAIVCQVLDDLKPSVVIHGDAKGVDKAAQRWAISRGVPDIACPADWDVLGKAAGVLRNQAMRDDHKPDMVVAFPGGVGTADMVDRANKAKVPVRFALRKPPRTKGKLF